MRQLLREQLSLRGRLRGKRPQSVRTSGLMYKVSVLPLFLRRIQYQVTKLCFPSTVKRQRPSNFLRHLNNQIIARSKFFQYSRNLITGTTVGPLKHPDKFNYHPPANISGALNCKRFQEHPCHFELFGVVACQITDQNVGIKRDHFPHTLHPR